MSTERMSQRFSEILGFTFEKGEKQTYGLLTEVRHLEEALEKERSDAEVLRKDLADSTAQLVLDDETIQTLREQIAEFEMSFNLYDGAMKRATKMWHAAGGEKLTWPRADKMMVWLLERIRLLEQACARFLAAFSDCVALRRWDEGYEEWADVEELKTALSRAKALLPKSPAAASEKNSDFAG